MGDKGITKAGDLKGIIKVEDLESTNINITKVEDLKGTEAKDYSVKKAGNGGEHH